MWPQWLLVHIPFWSRRWFSQTQRKNLAIINRLKATKFWEANTSYCSPSLGFFFFWFGLNTQLFFRNSKDHYDWIKVTSKFFYLGESLSVRDGENRFFKGLAISPPKKSCWWLDWNYERGNSVIGHSLHGTPGNLDEQQLLS